MAKAIETSYAGYRFRSRIEARWAVVFDKLNLKWEYESEGFNLPSGRYLPDFYLSTVNVNENVGAWFEVKGRRSNHAEQVQLTELAAETGKPALLSSGGIPKTILDFNWRSTNDSCLIAFPDGGGDTDYGLLACPVCGKVGFAFSHYAGRLCGHGDEHMVINGDGKRLINNALTAGRSARFEFGEVGNRWLE